MRLFQRIFFAAVLAGLAAGLVMSAVQQWKVAPLILAAEVFESAPHDHDHAAAAVDAAVPAVEEPEAWTPQDGPERIFYTVLADLLASIGFAFVLAGVALVSGLPITTRNGVIWGACGFNMVAQSAGVSVSASSAEKAIEMASVTENWR